MLKDESLNAGKKLPPNIAASGGLGNRLCVASVPTDKAGPTKARMRTVKPQKQQV
jgi:hypothetical protein